MFIAALLLAGILCLFGFLAFAGGMMSDAPSEGNADANMGAFMILGAIVIVAAAFIARHFHYFG